MNLETSLLLFLRLMPAIIVFALAFVAASDHKTREQWVNLLYGAGILRPEQRSDAKVQRGVRLPFFIVATALLIWPLRYYQHVTRTIHAKTDVFSRVSDIAPRPATAGNSTSTATPNSATSVAPVAPPMPGAPQAETRPNMFGTPVPLTTPAAAPSPVSQVPVAPAPIAPPPPNPPSAP
jgi:hypothetical protein